MNKIALLFVASLLMASSFALAEADSSNDLRYCLDLPSDQQIAKCAGEISAGNKGRPFSKEEVDKILYKEKTSAPINANESSGTPATASDKPSKDLLPRKTESNSN
jgi:hypothetical protein